MNAAIGVCTGLLAKAVPKITLIVASKARTPANRLARRMVLHPPLSFLPLSLFLRHEFGACNPGLRRGGLRSSGAHFLAVLFVVWSARCGAHGILEFPLRKASTRG